MKMKMMNTIINHPTSPVSFQKDDTKVVSNHVDDDEYDD